MPRNLSSKQPIECTSLFGVNKYIQLNTVCIFKHIFAHTKVPLAICKQELMQNQMESMYDQADNWWSDGLELNIIIHLVK